MVIILSSNTGGGHRACADALKAALEAKYQTEVRIIDLWSDHAPFPLNQLPSTYPYLIEHIPWFWRLLWRATQSQPLSTIFFFLIAKWAGRHILTTLAKLEPDAIICVHPIVQRAVLASLDQAPHIPNAKISALRALPWFTVVTDLCASHPYWFDPHAKRCFIDGPISARYAQKYGLHAQQIRAHGLPIHPAFGSLLAKIGKNGRGFSACVDLRRKLGMDPHLPAALIIGGGDGVGPVALVTDQIARHFSAASGPRGQLVVLCGHNDSLRRSLQQRTWPVPVRLCGFVENVPEWMAAADCVVTKAGPSTIAEAVSMGKPIALMGFIPGQESENVSFVEDGGAGLYCADPAGLAHIVRHWLIDEPQSRMAFVDAAKKLSTPLAATRIVDEIMELMWFSKKGNNEEDIFRQKK